MPRFPDGHALSGRFRLLAYVDAGGAGEVYEAEDVAEGRRVAVKVFHPELARGAEARERLRREVELASSLSHPNICATFALHEDGDAVFLTMELLAGETLEAYLAREGPMSAEESLPLVAQMGAALSAAHEAGVVHGDFKSGNVILVPDGDGVRAVVTDFGTGTPRAEPPAGEDRPELVVGTPAYMAPEQAKGQPLTPAADVFALGVVLYEMRTGALPQEGETIEELLQMRVDELAPAPHEHAPDLDARWELAILQCLQPEPEDRFETVRDVVDALSGRSIARSPRARREARRRRWVLAGAAAAAVAAAAATAWLMR